MAHSELAKGADRWRISRLRESEQSVATQSIESEGKLRLADFGGDPPAPRMAGEHETDLVIIRAEGAAWKQAGKPDDIAGWSLDQRPNSGRAVAEREMRPHEILGCGVRHRYAGEGMAHHVAVTEYPLLKDWNIVLDRRAKNQPRRGQDSEGLPGRGTIVLHRFAIPQVIAETKLLERRRSGCISPIPWQGLALEIHNEPIETIADPDQALRKSPIL
jgi:hypothetical protein